MKNEKNFFRFFSFFILTNILYFSIFTYMENENKNENTMLSTFPLEELARMIKNIDRFDTDVVNEDKKNAAEAIEKSEELTEKIVEENL